QRHDGADRRVGPAVLRQRGRREARGARRLRAQRRLRRVEHEDDGGVRRGAGHLDAQRRQDLDHQRRHRRRARRRRGGRPGAQGPRPGVLRHRPGVQGQGPVAGPEVQEARHPRQPHLRGHPRRPGAAGQRAAGGEGQARRAAGPGARARRGAGARREAAERPAEGRPGRHGDVRGVAPGRRRAGGRHRAGGLRVRPGLRQDARAVRPAHRGEPGHRLHAGRHEDQARREPAARLARGVDGQEQHPVHRRRGLHEQAVRGRDRRRGDREGHPDPGRQRLHARVPRRALAPRRQDLHDLRGHQRDPAADHQPGDLRPPDPV
ncbi:MAG: Acyl-CoA dehydrogenase, short-chain specific, partial [uncultured Solirubrobacteraceae bacterium]